MPFSRAEQKKESTSEKVVEFTDNVTDKDGNVYRTVKIGTQIWMAENLKTTKYNDSTSIPLVSDGAAWAKLSKPGYCWYKNDSATYKTPFGALYNWYTVKTGKICPTGWHVPTDSEWSVLTKYLGGDYIAGDKLRETGTIHWRRSYSATNETGFTALPGGSRNFFTGDYDSIGSWGYWWSSSTLFKGRSPLIDGIYRSFNRHYADKRNGFSVHCLKD
jgi:uncharacterized protein (TIGR02145 family)